MARPRKKKRTYRNLDFTPSSPDKKQIQTRQIVLTLAAPDGDVIKIEKLEKSGQRREVTDEEFADLAGEDAVDWGAALEHAYTAGIEDALKDELSEHDEDEQEEEEILRRFILKRAAGRQLLRRGVRKLILRRALHRQLAGRQAHSEGGAAGSKQAD